MLETSSASGNAEENAQNGRNESSRSSRTEGQSCASARGLVSKWDIGAKGDTGIFHRHGTREESLHWGGVIRGGLPPCRSHDKAGAVAEVPTPGPCSAFGLRAARPAQISRDARSGRGNVT